MAKTTFKPHEVRAGQLTDKARNGLRSAMEKQGKTVYGIAAATELPKMNVHRVMHDDCPLALHTVAIIAEHLGLSVDGLLGLAGPAVSKGKRKVTGPKRRRVA